VAPLGKKSNPEAGVFIQMNPAFRETEAGFVVFAGTRGE